MRKKSHRARLVACTLALLAFAPSAHAGPYDAIEHVIIIPLENHSFDNLFGFFPGADGLQNLTAEQYEQRDLNGKTYAFLPAVMDTRAHPAKPDARFPKRLPNAPFLIDQYVPAGKRTGDLVHRFYPQQSQIHNGKMDRFAALSDAGGLSMGYYDGSQLALWDYAKRYTLMDHFFHGAFGGSLINHLWLACACVPQFDAAPDRMRIQLDAQGMVRRSGAITQDGYVVNTAYSTYKPHKKLHDAQAYIPPIRMPTIADRLEAKNISWAWYSGGYDAAMRGTPDALYQYHHQPFVYFEGFSEHSPRRSHLKDGDAFLEDVKKGSLPAVSFYKPLGEFNLHPSYAKLTSGDQHIGDVLKQIEASPAWDKTLVIVTFDENGGYWDHVAPPTRDRFGPGMRVPTLLISPFARKGYVDKTIYDTTSILKFLEVRFGLEPLNTTDAAATDLGNALILH